MGHLHTIFGGVGDVNRVVDSSVGERIGGSAAHLDLLHLRLAYTGTLWALMVISALILWVRRHPPLTLSVLAAAPFVLVVQNYGSEGVLRIFLFSSPFACLIVAQLLVGLTTRRLAQVIVAVVAVALIPVFVLTRYGNESFEQVRPAEIEAIRTLYAIAPPGSDLVSPTAQIPWRFEFATDYDYSRPRDPLGFRRGDPGAIRTLVAPTSHEPPATYLVVTTGQVLYASEAEGSPSDWFERVRPMLTPANGYRLVYENPDAVIYQYQDPQ